MVIYTLVEDELGDLTIVDSEVDEAAALVIQVGNRMVTVGKGARDGSGPAVRPGLTRGQHSFPDPAEEAQC